MVERDINIYIDRCQYVDDAAKTLAGTEARCSFLLRVLYY